MKIRTHLISGAGNTFHLTYFENPAAISVEKKKEAAKRICFENPADGFIFLSQGFTSELNNDYHWWFYNNDGSDAEMCGNATRCVGFYLKNIIKNNSRFWNLKTTAGIVKIEFIGAQKYKITMPPIKKLKSELGFFCNTGVPHLVVEKNQIGVGEALKTEARNLRQNKSFLPKGTNVTFIVMGTDSGKIKAISYERGVEDFTLACGTGAVAAAFFNLTNCAVKQTQVEMPGGTLMIDLSEIDKPVMTGPAVLLGSFEYEISI